MDDEKRITLPVSVILPQQRYEELLRAECENNVIKEAARSLDEDSFRKLINILLLKATGGIKNA